MPDEHLGDLVPDAETAEVGEDDPHLRERVEHRREGLGRAAQRLVELVGAGVEEDGHVVGDRGLVDGRHARFVGRERLVLRVQLHAPQAERGHASDLGGRVLELGMHRTEGDDAATAD